MKEIEKFLINFLEKESEVFSGFPICPFAKKERLTGNIKFFACSHKKIEPEKVLMGVIEWLESEQTTLLLVDNDNSSLRETKYFSKCVKVLLEKNDVFISTFHPDHPNNLSGVYTRKSPRPFLAVNANSDIKKAKSKLVKTRYYNKLTEEDMGVLHPKKKKKWQKLKK